MRLWVVKRGCMHVVAAAGVLKHGFRHFSSGFFQLLSGWGPPRPRGANDVLFPRTRSNTTVVLILRWPVSHSATKVPDGQVPAPSQRSTRPSSPAHYSAPNNARFAYSCQASKALLAPFAPRGNGDGRAGRRRCVACTATTTQEAPRQRRRRRRRGRRVRKRGRTPGTCVMGRRAG